MTLIAEGADLTPNGQVVMNPVLHAMREFQEQMKGEADRAGFHTDEDVSEYITQLRREARSA